MLGPSVLSIFMSTCFQAASRVRPRNTLAPFVRVRCVAKRTILACLERRAVHMEPCTWPSQTCFVSLLGFVSFSTYFPIRNQWQLVTLWNGPRTLSIGCVWMASWVDSPQVCGDGAGAALLRGARCGQASITWWTQCYHDLRRPGSAVRMFMRPFVWAECAQHIHVNVLPGCFQISRANPKRLQLLKRGSVLETHWHHLFGSGVRQKGQFWRTGKAGLFPCSRARGLHKLASYACLDSQPFQSTC